MLCAVVAGVFNGNSGLGAGTNSATSRARSRSKAPKNRATRNRPQPRTAIPEKPGGRTAAPTGRQARCRADRWPRARRRQRSEQQHFRPAAAGGAGGLTTPGPSQASATSLPSVQNHFSASGSVDRNRGGTLLARCPSGTPAASNKRRARTRSVTSSKFLIRGLGTLGLYDPASPTRPSRRLCNSLNGVKRLKI